MTPPQIGIRVATEDDLPAITAIYNEAILTTTATFDTEPKTLEDRLQWFKAHDDRHPILVAVADGQVAGWASLTRWNPRKAYDDTAETSFYVKAEHRGCGIGWRLKQAITQEAQRLKFHTLIAQVAEGSDESLHLNAKAGFRTVGTLKEVGHKFGKLLDVHILQKVFAITLLLVLCGCKLGPSPAPVPSASPAVALPGAQRDGSILLPNQWSLRPAGKQMDLRDIP